VDRKEYSIFNTQYSMYKGEGKRVDRKEYSIFNTQYSMYKGEGKRGIMTKA
jgi:hypothetical protein